jgi:hypothetical protein
LASFPIITFAFVGTSAIGALDEKNDPKERFKSEYDFFLTIHSLTLYLNKIKMLALSFRT